MLRKSQAAPSNPRVAETSDEGSGTIAPRVIVMVPLLSVSIGMVL